MFKDSRSKITVLLVFFAMFWSYPYIFGRITYEINLNILYGFVLIGLLLVSSRMSSKRALPHIFQKICIFQFFGFLVLSIVHQDFFYIFRYALFIVIVYFILWVISNTVTISYFSKINCNIICIQAFFAALTFVFVLFDLIQPLMVISAGGERLSYFYGLSSSLQMVGNVTRQTGFFDEPGALAFWGMYTLIFNKLFFNNKKTEWLLFLCLIFTFSMAFYIQMILYLIFFYGNRIKQLIVFLFILFICGYYVYKYEGTDSTLYVMTFQRFQKGDSGQLETNRDEATITGKKYFLLSPIFGNGKTNLEKRNISVVDAPFETLAQDGIWGTFFIYLPLLYAIFKYRRKNQLFGVIILTVGYLQRPYHIQFLHYLYVYLFFLMIYYENNNTLESDLNK